jgi:cytoskeleton protein RodZ
MPETLGEKLRQAREARGYSVSDVAEQTRISPHYIESIESDDYSPLPGGIFNKGFVKSYAKFVGINEQEALSDYSQLMSSTTSTTPETDKTYRPEVLTDDRSSGSNIPTIVFAVVILALMTAGVLFFLNYYQRSDSTQASSPTPQSTPETAVNNTPETGRTEGGIPEMSSIRVELKANKEPVILMASVDGEAARSTRVPAGEGISFSPKESITLNFSRWNSDDLEMFLNGKSIGIPTQPLDAKDRDRIIFTLSRENLADVLNRGAIANAAPTAQVTPEANVPPATQRPASTPPVRTSTPRTTPAATSNSNPSPAATPRTAPARPAGTPAATPRRTPEGL